jgi:hypothetical protein
MNRNEMLWTGVGLVAVALILTSRPTCNRGCRTLAEHLIQHGVNDIVDALLA